MCLTSIYFMALLIDYRFERSLIILILTRAGYKILFYCSVWAQIDKTGTALLFNDSIYSISPRMLLRFWRVIGLTVCIDNTYRMRSPVLNSGKNWKRSLDFTSHKWVFLQYLHEYSINFYTGFSTLFALKIPTEWGLLHWIWTVNDKYRSGLLQCHISVMWLVVWRDFTSWATTIMFFNTMLLLSLSAHALLCSNLSSAPLVPSGQLWTPDLVQKSM
jgi:hypothetical protein